jgi:hypothetical protein
MNINFDARQVQPSQPMEPVPEGWYPVVLADEEQKAVKDKPHLWLLAMTYEIIDGPMKGRKVMDNLNLGSDNQQAVEIAGRTLSALCHVTGQYVLNEQTGGTAALKGKPFQIKVTIEGAYNRIKGYKDMQGNDPGKTGATGGPAAPAAAPPQAPPLAAAPAPAWGAPPAQQAQPAPVAAGPAWSAPPAQQPAQSPWGGGQPAQPAAAPAPAQPAWGAQPAQQMPAQAPWAR